jgi:rod shape-determining protein MreC
MAVARRTSQRVTLVMLVLASVTVITLDYKGDARHTIASVRNAARDVVAPAQRLIADALHPIGDLFSGAVNYGAAQTQIQQLQKEIGALQQQDEQQSIFEQQYKQLLQLENIPFVGNIPTVTARIIQSSTSNFNEEIQIDKGYSSGIGPGEPVVAGNGLTGLVVSVSSSTAMVELVDDPRSSVGVRFGNNELAVVNGTGPGGVLDLENLATGSPIHVGETVYTSGLLPAAYPADIPVGTVASVQQVKGAFTTPATVKPFVNFSTLQYVAVLQWMPPA